MCVSYLVNRNLYLLVGDKKTITCTLATALAALSVKAQKRDREPFLTGWADFMENLDFNSLPEHAHLHLIMSALLYIFIVPWWCTWRDE